MTVKIDGNKIKNSTIAKLTRDEISELGLCNCGIITYKGELKSRLNGLKVTEKTDTLTVFECETLRWEVIKIVSTSDKDEYAIRVYDKDRNSYEDFFPILTGCRFFR